MAGGAAASTLQQHGETVECDEWEHFLTCPSGALCIMQSPKKQRGGLVRVGRLRAKNKKQKQAWSCGIKLRHEHVLLLNQFVEGGKIETECYECEIAAW